MEKLEPDVIVKRECFYEVSDDEPDPGADNHELNCKSSESETLKLTFRERVSGNNGPLLQKLCKLEDGIKCESNGNEPDLDGNNHEDDFDSTDSESESLKSTLREHVPDDNGPLLHRLLCKLEDGIVRESSSYEANDDEPDIGANNRGDNVDSKNSESESLVSTVRESVSDENGPLSFLHLEYAGPCELTEANPSEQIEANASEKPYKCELCDARYKYSCLLKRHMPVHTGEKPFNCDICGLPFARKGDLKQHKVIHTGVRPHVCGQCNANFADKGNLRRHVKLHNTEKQYKCNECGAAFKRKGHVNRHMIIHTGEKPFTCNECGATFTQNSSLRVHQRIHTGERPFRCGACDNTFASRGDLRKHAISHIEEQSHECVVCGSVFKRERYLRRHHIKMHRYCYSGLKPK